MKESCNTGLSFDIPKGLTLEVAEFIEMMEELVSYCNREGMWLLRRPAGAKRRGLGRCGNMALCRMVEASKSGMERYLHTKVRGRVRVCVGGGCV